MAICNQPHHVGDRQVFRTILFYKDGKERVEGCRPCVEPMLTPVYSTQKRLVVSRGTHKHYYISPAHRRNIELRKLAPDGRTVYQNRRGNLT